MNEKVDIPEVRFNGGEGLLDGLVALRIHWAGEGDAVTFGDFFNSPLHGLSGQVSKANFGLLFLEALQNMVGK